MAVCTTVVPRAIGRISLQNSNNSNKRYSHFQNELLIGSTCSKNTQSGQTIKLQAVTARGSSNSMGRLVLIEKLGVEVLPYNALPRGEPPTMRCAESGQSGVASRARQSATAGGVEEKRTPGKRSGEARKPNRDEGRPATHIHTYMWSDGALRESSEAK